ncbi:MAG: DUF417 family protein [Pirellulaceae bacterium]
MGVAVARTGLLFLCLNLWLPPVTTVGRFLVFVMSLVTLPFLITTPEPSVLCDLDLAGQHGRTAVGDRPKRGSPEP